MHPTEHGRKSNPPETEILVVDDDFEMRSLLAEELREDGYRVTVAKNGLDVMSEIPFRRYDLIVTDWQLPLRDGMLIVDAVRELHPDVPVVLITAYGDAKVRRKAKKLGCTYVQKPFSMDAFRELIRSLLLESRRPGA